jgi:hypothetical protein
MTNRPTRFVYRPIYMSIYTVHQIPNMHDMQCVMFMLTHLGESISDINGSTVENEVVAS